MSAAAKAAHAQYLATAVGDDDHRRRRAAVFEIHMAWCRLSLSRVHLEWAQRALTDSYLSPEGALEILETAMAEIVGEAR